MATYVCYRACCRQVFQQISRPFISVPRSSFSSQILANTNTPVSSSLLRGVRCYHGLIPRATSQPSSLHIQTWLSRGFRSQRSKTKVIKLSSGSERPGLFRPVMFTAFVCSSSFVGCMIWQYEAMRQRAQEVMKGLERQYGGLFEPNYEKQIGFRAHMNAMWNNLTDGQKMVAGLIGLNFLVFLAWKAPALHPALMRYFASMPGNPVISMVLSAFSHFNLWHIGANMYVLWSFANVSLNLFGKEQWLAVYLSSASLSALASLMNKVLRHGVMPVSPSLGASGAIMCLLGAVCVTHPDARLSIAFVGDLFPHSFSASSALKFILLLDTAGLVMGWRVFDHAAHLGGVLFGIWYATYGHKMIWGHRETVMKWWHQVRGKPSK